MLNTAHGYAVITAVNDTIRYRNVTAWVDIKAVGIQHIDGVKDLVSAHPHIFTAMQKDRPAPRISHGYILHPHVLALNKYDKLTGTKLFGIFDFKRTRAPSEPLRIVEIIIYKSVAVSVNRSKACYSNVFNFMGDDKVLSNPVLKMEVPGAYILTVLFP